MLLFSEIFEQIELAVSKEERITILQKNKSDSLIEFFRLLYDTNIEFDVEIPNYRPAPEPAGLNFTYLDVEMSKMYRFVVGHPKRPQGLKPEKQKSLLLVVLESLHKDEAELLVKLIKKDLGIPTLTKKIVQEAFPDLYLG